MLKAKDFVQHSKFNVQSERVILRSLHPLKKGGRGDLADGAARANDDSPLQKTTTDFGSNVER